MRRPSISAILFGASTLGVLLFMYVPIGVMVVFSFSDSAVVSFPITGWTTRWYHKAWIDDTGFRNALLHSVIVALCATVIATTLGTLAAFAVVRYRFFGRHAFRIAVIAPLLLPGIVTGMAMVLFFRMAGIQLGMTTVIIGHATFCFPIAFNTMAARVARLPRNLEEAAADLGATPLQVYRKVIFPSTFSAIVAGSLLAFTLSLDEIVVTYFLAVGFQTLPTEIYARLRRTFAPDVLAVVTVILGFSLTLVLFAQWLTESRGRPGRT